MTLDAVGSKLGSSSSSSSSIGAATDNISTREYIRVKIYRRVYYKTAPHEYCLSLFLFIEGLRGTSSPLLASVFFPRLWRWGNSCSNAARGVFILLSFFCGGVLCVVRVSKILRTMRCGADKCSSNLIMYTRKWKIMRVYLTFWAKTGCTNRIMLIYLKYAHL